MIVRAGVQFVVPRAQVSHLRHGRFDSKGRRKDTHVQRNGLRLPRIGSSQSPPDKSNAYEHCGAEDCKHSLTDLGGEILVWLKHPNNRCSPRTHLERSNLIFWVYPVPVPLANAWGAS